jgi:Flp pilus assembly protein TadD
MAKIVFVGNCQIQSICNAYNAFVSPWTGDSGHFVDAYSLDPAAAAAAFEGADILVGQVAETKSNIDVDGISAGVVRYRVPVVTGSFLWPFGGQPHPQSPSTARRYMPLGPYSAEFGDSYLNRMINRGVDRDEILKKYIDLDLNKMVNLDRLLELNLEQQRKRDSVTGFNMAEVIEKYFREEHLFLTPYHPNLRVARSLIQQTFALMGVGQTAIDRVEKWLTITPFPKHSSPIHPSVQRHFGLKYAGPGYRFRYYSEGTFTFEEYVSRYLQFEWNEALEEGLALASERKLEAAVETLTIGLQRSPQSGNGFHSLSGVLDSLGRADDAIAAARTAVELEPNDSSAVRHLGVILGRTEHAQEAEQFLEKAISLSPGSAEYYVALSHFLQRQRRTDEAIAAVREAIERDPSVSSFRVHLAVLLEAKGADREAESELRRAVDQSPNTAHARRQLSHLLAKQNKLDEAVVEAQRAVDLEPDTAASVRHLGVLLGRVGRFEEGERLLRKAIELSPESAEYYFALSHMLHQQRRSDEAIGATRQAVERDPAAVNFRIHLAALYETKGELHESEKALREAVERVPEAAPLHHALSHVLARQNKIAEAMTPMRRALSLEPNNAAHVAYLGHLLNRSGQYADAEGMLRRAIELAPRSPGIHHDLSHVLERLGRRGEAITLLRQLISSGVEDSHVRARLGHLLQSSGDLTAAEREFRAACEKYPGVAGLRAALADVLNRQGKRDEAVNVLRDVIAGGTSDPHIHGLLGHLLLQASDLAGAEHEFRTALGKGSEGSNFRVHLADVLKRQGKPEEAAAFL